MTGRIFALFSILGLLVAPSAAWSAQQWSRGQCIDAVHQKLGTRAADAGTNTNKAAVMRCIKHGPDSI